MSSRTPTTWMWAEACQLLDEAERLHRSFFRRGAVSDARTAWEPPVDIFEDEERFVIVVALPGVPPDCIEVAIEGHILVIRADCEIPLRAPTYAVRRLEIPHGYFERRIELPPVELEFSGPQTVNGCLVLNLDKVL